MPCKWEEMGEDGQYFCVKIMSRFEGPELDERCEPINYEEDCYEEAPPPRCMHLKEGFKPVDGGRLMVKEDLGRFYFLSQHERSVLWAALKDFDLGSWKDADIRKAYNETAKKLFIEIESGTACNCHTCVAYREKEAA